MSRKLLKLISALTLVFCSATIVYAQANKGQISGQISDPQGLPVPKAKIEITNQDTSVSMLSLVYDRD